jgi:hypothetical protein
MGIEYSIFWLQNEISMSVKTGNAAIILLLAGGAIMLMGNRESKVESQLPDWSKLAEHYYQQDARWYLDNVPFFECSDKQIEQVYHYRWKLYKAHIRSTGTNDYVITEFINHVSWDRDPYCTINAASMHHIYEGRWLRDQRYMDGYINYLYQQGGNNRQYSEGIADAAYARYLVNADARFLTRQLDSMKYLYNQWSDHWEDNKALYYIAAMPDATEYTIASIDASGGKDGFAGGEAFRPTINSYMYGNAVAISMIAAMKGDQVTSAEYAAKAAALQATVSRDLWNDSLQHFTDRFKVNNEYVRYWDFIRGRELAGFIPWYYNLPPDSAKYNAAWKHLTGDSGLLGKYGLRTNEPSYEYYFRQFVFTFGQPGSQWNGPSWPYQTSQVITGMANMLNNYKQDVVTTSNYLKILRLYTRQHYLPGGKINLVENYDPNTGGPIVHYYWSNHYNHSSYNDLIISGLCGIRPSAGDTLLINPLIDPSIKYFLLDNVMYHGHKLTVMYDHDGSRYQTGKGLSVWVDGNKAMMLKTGNKYQVVVGTPLPMDRATERENFALNIRRKEYPLPSASINSAPDSIYQAIDGRIWFFPEISNQWSTKGSTSTTDWFALDFGRLREISTIKIYPYADENFGLPDKYSLEYNNGNEWIEINIKESKPANIIANTMNILRFENIKATQIRLTFQHATRQIALSEVQCY